MSISSKTIYHFGPFELNPAQGQLLRNGEAVVLTPKALQMLVLLIEKRGEVIDKETFIRGVWPGVHIDDSNVAQHMFWIRKALADPEGTTYIETVARRGYRFIAPVREENKLRTREVQPASKTATSFPSASAAQANRVKIIGVTTSVLVLATLGAAISYFMHREIDASASIRSVAVLPFVSVGGDTSDHTLELGIADSLITQLAQMHVPVRPIAAVAGFNENGRDALVAGRKMRVDAVLDGSVEKVDGGLRISARLFRVSDGQALWIGRYEKPAKEILAVQDRISEEIANVLESNHSQARIHLAHAQTTNPNAYREYIQGRYLWSTRAQAAFPKAIAHFESAIRQDPHYAAAYAGLADAYALLGCGPDLGISRPVAMQRAKFAALAALKLDDSLAEPHASLAFELMHFEWKWADAEKEFRRAIELDPDYATAHQWYAYDLLALDRPNEALAESRRAQELDPTSVIMNSDVAEFLYYDGQFKASEQLAHAILDMDPGFLFAHASLYRSFAHEHRTEEALREAELAGKSDAEREYAKGLLAAAYAAAGQRKEAQSLIAQMLRQKNSPAVYQRLAIAYAGMGDVGQAAVWLEKSYREHAEWPLLVDPVWDVIRTNPKIVELEKRYGVPVLADVP